MVAFDSRGYVYVDGVKIARLDGGELEFLDRDPERIRQRGTRFVKIGIKVLFLGIVRHINEDREKSPS